MSSFALPVKSMLRRSFATFWRSRSVGELLQAPERCNNGPFWVLVAPEKHVLFEFSQKHDSDAPANLLDGYEGYLVAQLAPARDVIPTVLSVAAAFGSSLRRRVGM